MDTLAQLGIGAGAIFSLAALIRGTFKIVFWGKKLVDLVEQINHEVHPNNGLSLADKVNEMSLVVNEAVGVRQHIYKVQDEMVKHLNAVKKVQTADRRVNTKRHKENQVAIAELMIAVEHIHV